METTYINYATVRAESRWQRRTFVKRWWSIYAGDVRWVPPYYPTLRREIEPGANSHLARLRPFIVHIEAYPRREQSAEADEFSAAAAMFAAPHGGVNLPSNVPLAAAVVLVDPRRSDGTAYLGLLHCANEAEALERLLWHLAEDLRPHGCRRLIGPTSLSPHLWTGALQDHWDRLPPLHTQYNPPYLPELLDNVMSPTDSTGRLYHLEVPAVPPSVEGPAEVVSVAPHRLSDDLLPLLQAAGRPAFPAPDAHEGRFLLRWLGDWPLHAWCAAIDGEPVGLVLLQPDLAARLHRARGGRNPVWRLWLRLWGARRPSRAGRVLYGAVLPEWRRRGIGRQLLQQALRVAGEQGWATLTISPIPSASKAARRFLEAHGARPRQTYRVYDWHI